MLGALTSLTGGGGLKLQGGAGGAAGPSTASLKGGASSFDSSNWTVATGSSTATGGLQLTPLMIGVAAVVGVLVLWRLTKK